ncbi:periplasmic solute binding family protein, partial [Vibrio harveyi]
MVLTSTFAPFSYGKDIITSTPVTYMLSEQLMQGTGIETSYLPPKRYGVERLVNWFASKGQQQAIKAGQEATVAITLGAIWHQDPTFVYARQGNIRLIEIDASQAISPRAPGVAALTLDNGDTSKYAWMNPTNLIRMAAIVGEDLQKVYPQYQAQIEKNQQALM